MPEQPDATQHRPSGLRKYRNQIIIGIIMVLGIYIALLLLLDSTGQMSGGVIAQIQQFPLWLVMPLIICQLFVILFRFIEWQYYLGVIGARDKISLLDSLIIFTAGFTMVVSPGKAAEVLKAVFLKAKTGVPIARSAPVVIAERVVDGLAVIVIMLITLLVAGDQLGLGEYDAVSRTIIFSSAALLAFGLIVVQIQPLAYLTLNMVARVPLVNKLHTPLVEFYESSREIFKLRHVIPMTFIGVFIYGWSALGFFIVLMGFGLPPTAGLFIQVAFIVGVSSAVGALSFVPNGAGVTEISNTGMLLAVIAPTYAIITPPVAAAAALIQSFFHKWFRVLIGLLVIVIFRNRLFSEDIETILAEIETEKHSEAGKRDETGQATRLERA